MRYSSNNNNILSILDDFTLDNSTDIAMQVAEDFRKRRVEKICREFIYEQIETGGVSKVNILAHRFFTSGWRG